ncbi:MAG: ribose 5-phosphate isomerase B [Parcubacteria bacterium C7867-001]|nr:MAG: ribose 5-phosphate isomerase B [Parcubacteria bacterium C7867-001]
MVGMQIFIASDHAGFELKESLRAFLAEAGHTVEDCGAFEKNEGDDYPDTVIPCAQKVAEMPDSFGIVIGASGQGEAMAANRVSGVRAAVFYGDVQGVQTDAEGGALSLVQSVRAHNNANILSLGARFITEEEAQTAVRIFLETPFSGDERHVRRLAKF